VSQIDRAYLRRFDFAIEFRRLPRPARRRILEKHLEGLAIPSRAIDQLADQDALLPSQVAKAAKIVRIWPGDESVAEAVLGRVVQAGMHLLDMRASVSAKQATHRCRLEYFSTDLDIQKLITNLKAQAEPSGALCFFGPPGTGKTLLAHVMAAELNRPLMAKKGSDLLSPYVGGTEQGIAQMFDAAREEQAVLLLDEVDGLLMERRDARQRWELTQVNEILTQMDQFNGLLICSTNLASALDVASLRRFDIKVRFDYLTQHQRWRLFLDVLALEEETIEARHWYGNLKRLSVLTPGDFAVASRRAALLGLTVGAASLYQLLEDECEAKQALTGRPIGFLN
jgi:SpoVK/Ycf46/Vps4 family AAA+-type ATPase